MPSARTLVPGPASPAARRFMPAMSIRSPGPAWPGAEPDFARLTRMLYRPGLLEGFLASAGLDLTPFCSSPQLTMP